MMAEDFTSPPFDHPMNITEGQIRIIYVEFGRQGSGGWILPGCRYTDDKHTARAYAVRLNNLVSRSTTLDT